MIFLPNKMMKLLVRNRFNFGWDQDLQNWAEADSNDPGYQLFMMIIYLW